MITVNKNEAITHHRPPPHHNKTPHQKKKKKRSMLKIFLHILSRASSQFQHASPFSYFGKGIPCLKSIATFTSNDF